MKINLNPNLPLNNDLVTLKTRLTDLLREIAVQLNNLSEGRLSGKYAATTAAPSTGTWVQGDVVYNSTPSELGTAGNKYVITSWVCVTSGTPGTWVACRSLTGN